MKCGREPHGEKVAELGLCPTALAFHMNGIHSGENAGRACWVVAGTMCGGEVQGSYSRKVIDCTRCEFYKQVWDEEGSGKHVLHPLDLLKIAMKK